MFGQRTLKQRSAILLAAVLALLKDYIKTLNNNLDGYNIDFFEDEKESIWMMANAYYKLISDHLKRTTKDEKVEDKEKKAVKA